MNVTCAKGFNLAKPLLRATAKHINSWGDSLLCCSSHSRVWRTSEKSDFKLQIHYRYAKNLTNNILKAEENKVKWLEIWNDQERHI